MSFVNCQFLKTIVYNQNSTTLTFNWLYHVICISYIYWWNQPIHFYSNIWVYYWSVKMFIYIYSYWIFSLFVDLNFISSCLFIPHSIHKFSIIHYQWAFRIHICGRKYHIPPDKAFRYTMETYIVLHQAITKIKLPLSKLSWCFAIASAIGIFVGEISKILLFALMYKLALINGLMERWIWLSWLIPLEYRVIYIMK